MAKKIVIDPGHYGLWNQSPVVKGHYESKFAWELSNKVKKYLEANYKDVNVVLTRTDENKDLVLYQRGAKAKGADLFVSLHSNSCDSEKVDRVVVIYGVNAGSTQKEFAMELANDIKSTMGVKDKSSIYKRESTKHKGTEYYGVLRGAAAVGCKNRFIVEHSFHSNKRATLWMNDHDNITKLAETDAKAFAKFLGLQKKSTKKDTPKKDTPVNLATTKAKDGESNKDRFTRTFKAHMNNDLGTTFKDNADFDEEFKKVISDHNLEYGSSLHGMVRHIQYWLKKLGHYNGEVDGKFGPATKSAVIEFQKKYSLSKDGIVGLGTVTKMRAVV